MRVNKYSVQTTIRADMGQGKAMLSQQLQLTATNDTHGLSGRRVQTSADLCQIAGLCWEAARDKGSWIRKE